MLPKVICCEIINDRLARRGWMQSVLATELGVSPAVLSSWIKGSVRIDAERFSKIALTFGESVEDWAHEAQKKLGRAAPGSIIMEHLNTDPTTLLTRLHKFCATMPSKSPLVSSLLVIGFFESNVVPVEKIWSVLRAYSRGTRSMLDGLFETCGMGRDDRAVVFGRLRAVDISFGDDSLPARMDALYTFLEAYAIVHPQEMGRYEEQIHALIKARPTDSGWKKKR